jgi:carbonic anhydrase
MLHLLSWFFSVAVAAQPGVEWGYGANNGPERWAQLDTAWSVCTTGKRQSPIEIRDVTIGNLPALQLLYKASPLRVMHTGDTLRLSWEAGNRLKLGSVEYELTHLQMRTPSEHRVDGRLAEMEMQFFHRSKDGKLAIVSVLVEKGKENPQLEEIWQNLPREQDEELKVAELAFQPAGLFPQSKKYFFYWGSIPHPPCTEGVAWAVLARPVTFSQKQIDAYKKLFGVKSRPIQEANGRDVTINP